MPSAGAARDVVAGYVRAIDAHDGARVCGLFTDNVRNRLKLTFEGRTLHCEKLVAGYIGYADESGQPEWKSAHLAGIDRFEPGDGRASVTFGVMHRIAQYDPAVNRTVVHRVRLEDRLELVAHDGTWRLANGGGTLRAAGVPFVAPRHPRTDTAEHAVDDYLLALSGGPVSLCGVVPATIDCEHVVRQPWGSDDPAALWQSAVVRRLSTRAAGDRAVVEAALQETDVAGQRLVTKPVRAVFRLRRVAGRWVVDPSDPTSRHARGLAPEPAGPERVGSQVALPVGTQPYKLVATKADGALLLFMRAHSPAIRAAAVHGTRVAAASYAVAKLRQDRTVQFAPDPADGGAVAAWVDAGPSRSTVVLRRVAASGAPVGRPSTVARIDADAGGQPQRNLSALSVSGDGHVLVGWTVTAMSSRPALMGVIVDPSLRRASPERQLADDPGYGLALAPAPGGWLSAGLLADQPDPSHPIPPQIDMGLIPAQRSRHRIAAPWPGIENAGPLGAPALGAIRGGALMAYAHGDRPATVVAQPLTPLGAPRGAPVELGRVASASAGAVRMQVMAAGTGYRVAWSYRGDRETPAMLVYADVDARGRLRSRRRVISLEAAVFSDLGAPHLMTRTTTVPTRPGRQVVKASVLALP